MRLPLKNITYECDHVILSWFHLTQWSPASSTLLQMTELYPFSQLEIAHCVMCHTVFVHFSLERHFLEEHLLALFPFLGYYELCCKEMVVVLSPPELKWSQFLRWSLQGYLINRFKRILKQKFLGNIPVINYEYIVWKNKWNTATTLRWIENSGHFQTA
jgi:hypothetical protein